MSGSNPVNARGPAPRRRPIIAVPPGENSVPPLLRRQAGKPPSAWLHVDPPGPSRFRMTAHRSAKPEVP